jgi:hypothetical protein
VITAIKQSKLHGDTKSLEGAEWIKLPDEFKDLSGDTDHIVKVLRPPGTDTLQVEFPIWMGCMGDCGGSYIYVSTDEMPHTPPDASAIDSTRLDAHWFWSERR